MNKRRKFACVAILVAVAPILTSCGKNVELTQEVRLSESEKKVKLRRKETFEPRLWALEFSPGYARSELTVVGSDLPAWKQRLLPMYFGELAEGAGYVLVAVIPDARGCAERGKPASPYVVYAAAKERWHEIPMPQYLEGRAANLALVVENYPLGNELIVKKIDLSAGSGC